MTWLQYAPELAPYQDEPLQLPTGSPGKNAFLHMTFARRGERSCLVDLERRAPLIVPQALYWDEGMPHLPCVHIISNSGGIVQGNRNAIEIRVKENAEAHVTTQSGTKIHQRDANFASQTQEIVLEEGGVSGISAGSDDSVQEYAVHHADADFDCADDDAVVIRDSDGRAEILPGWRVVRV